MKSLLSPIGQPVEAASAWVYEGVWGVLADLLRTPREAPTLPTLPGEQSIALKPSGAWLRYLKFWFWIALAVIDVAILGAWLIVCIISPVAGAILAVPAWILAIVPDIVAYVAIHLRYDTTWYILSPRSIRLRNGIWVIRETTFTFENVQNIEIAQGPVERWFGFANLRIETAGGGTIHTQHGPVADGSNVAFLFGLENAHEIRKLVLDRVAASRSAGLGDENLSEPGTATGPNWTPAHAEELQAMIARLRRVEQGMR